MDAIITDTVAKMAAAAVLGITGYLFKVRDRLARLETQMEDRKNVGVLVTDHEKRISVMERVVEDLHDLAPALLETATKVDALLQTALKRLDHLENRVYGDK